MSNGGKVSAAKCLRKFRVKPKKSVKNRKPTKYLTFKNLFFKNCKTFSRTTTIGYNVGSYTQGRIAGDFLSGRTRKSSGEPLTEYQLPPDLPGS